MIQQALIWAAAGTGFTFLMTTIGAAMVFFMKRQSSALMQQIFLGFASGVMIAFPRLTRPRRTASRAGYPLQAALSSVWCLCLRWTD